MTIEEAAEFVQKYLEPNRYKYYQELNEARRELYVFGFITRCENAKIKYRINESAVREAEAKKAELKAKLRRI